MTTTAVPVVVIQCTRWYFTFIIVLDDREGFILKTLQRIAKDHTNWPLNAGKRLGMDPPRNSLL